MKNQMYYLTQLQQLDNQMDARYKAGLPTPGSGRKPTKKQAAYIRKRNYITRQIRSSLIRHYEKRRTTNIRPNIVVPVANSVCRGCYMRVTKSLLGELIKSESVINCEHCGRLLYLKEEESHTLQNQLVAV